jgi:hypothetical protein
MKNVLLSAATALVLGTVALAPVAQARPDTLIVKVAPPAPKHERAMAARRGYEWAPGYWNYNGRRYVWVKGHYERVRRGQSYHASEWRQGDNGWVLHRGGWRAGMRDNDNDGVRNRDDSRPNNPNRN